MSFNLGERIEFAEGVLDKLGAPPTSQNMMILMMWMAHESSPDQEGPSPEFNPLATTKLWSEPGKFNDDAFGGRSNRIAESELKGMSFFNDLGGDLGVMNYADMQQGIDMTVSTLRDRAFKSIHDALMQGDLSVEEFNNVAEEALSIWSSDGYSALTADPDDHGITEALGGVTFPDPDPASGSLDWAFPDSGITDFKPTHQIVMVNAPTVDAGPGIGSVASSPRAAFLVISIPGLEDPTQGGAVVFHLSGMTSAVSLGDQIVDANTWQEMVSSKGWVIADGIHQYSHLIDPETGEARRNMAGPEESEDFQNILGFVNDLVYELDLAGDLDQLGEADVQGVIAQIIADPFLLEDPEGIKDRLRNTAWGQSRTLQEETWDSWTKGQRDAEVATWLEKIKSQYEAYVGIQSQTFDWDNELIGNHTAAKWANLIAQGLATPSAMVGMLKQIAINKHASGSGLESPYATIIREGQIASGQWDQDKADKTAWVEDIYRSWGLDPGTYGADVKAIANDLMMNTMSESDFMDDIRTTAMQKFPNKPEFLATKDWANPYMSLHDSEMDVPAGDFSNSLVMSALQAGEGLEAFRTRIRKTDDWKRSKKAKAVAADKMRAVGNTFGFNRGGGIF